MYKPIGAFDAKATLSKLLQEVQRGHRFTITVRGVPVADLVPIEDNPQKNAQTAIETMRRIRKIQGVSSEMVSEWISEGRR